MPEFYYKINSVNGAKQNIFLSLLLQAGVHINVIQLLYVVYPFLRRIILQGATPEVGAMAPGNEARTLTFINLNSKLPPNNTSLFCNTILPTKTKWLPDRLLFQLFNTLLMAASTEFGNSSHVKI